METIIVEILLGITGEVVEFMLPAHVPLASLMSGILRLVEQVHQNVSFDAATVMLYDAKQALPLEPAWTLAQSGIRDGSQLVLL